MNEREPSTSNEPTQSDSEAYEIPNERPYECTDNTVFTSPQPFDHDNTSEIGSAEYVIQPDTEDTHAPPPSPQYEIPNSRPYEYPDQSQSHQYEYPSLESKEADTKEKTDVCVQDGADSALVRPPLNKNESENGGYTSLNKDRKTTDKVGSTAKEDEADELPYVNTIDGDYTPLKSNESEMPVYQPLLKKGTEETNAAGKADEKMALL